MGFNLGDLFQFAGFGGGHGWRPGKRFGNKYADPRLEDRISPRGHHFGSGWGHRHHGAEFGVGVGLMNFFSSLFGGGHGRSQTRDYAGSTPSYGFDENDDVVPRTSARSRTSRFNESGDLSPEAAAEARAARPASVRYDDDDSYRAPRTARAEQPDWAKDVFNSPGG